MRSIMYVLLSAISLLCSCGADPMIGEEKFVIKIDIEGIGKVKRAGVFNNGDICKLTAVPDTVNGYRFEAWLQLPENVVVSSDKNYTFEVDENRTLKVIFVK